MYGVEIISRVDYPTSHWSLLLLGCAEKGIKTIEGDPEVLYRARAELGSIRETTPRP